MVAAGDAKAGGVEAAAAVAEEVITPAIPTPKPDPITDAERSVAPEVPDELDPEVQKEAHEYHDPPPHVSRYLDAVKAKGGRRTLIVTDIKTDQRFDAVDVAYKLTDDAWVHVHKEDDGLWYEVLEPVLDDIAQEILPRLLDAIFTVAQYREPPKNQAQLEKDLNFLFGQELAKVTEGQELSDEQIGGLRYRIIRDVARLGPLEPLVHDPYLEDIHAVGTDPIHVIHRHFAMMPSNLAFPDLATVDQYVRNLAERTGRPVSDARPIVDATLSDGSRINIVYAEDVSRKGPSFSIRRVHANPISITQLIQWGTMSAEIVAYLWLCLENGMSVMVCGEAACGKSATLNALMAFIDPRSKLYTAEDTPEIRPPHLVWQRLLTRETGPEDARVGMFDLLRAALRSRPNYIVVGEIRGAEGAVAFQAMQTGHPTVATFHATDKVKLIQRLSAPPIDIPLTFMDNLNVAVFQQAMKKGDRLIRRVTSIDEIQGYSDLDGGVITLPVFTYNAKKDGHKFQGENNSHILEKKIAEQHGYEDPTEIYRVLQHRAKVLQGMVDHGIMNFDDVNAVLFKYHDIGDDALPFDIEPYEGDAH